MVFMEGILEVNYCLGELEGVYGTFTPSTITLNEIYLKFPVSVSFWGIVLTLMHEGAHAVTWKLSMTRNEYITHVVSGWLIEMVMYTQYEENILFPKWEVGMVGDCFSEDI